MQKNVSQCGFCEKLMTGVAKAGKLLHYRFLL